MNTIETVTMSSCFLSQKIFHGTKINLYKCFFATYAKYVLYYDISYLFCGELTHVLCASKNFSFFSNGNSNSQYITSKLAYSDF